MEKQEVLNFFYELGVGHKSFKLLGRQQAEGGDRIKEIIYDNYKQKVETTE